MTFYKNISKLTLTFATLMFAVTKGAFAWDLIWSDEFNYEGVPDKSKWVYETAYVRNGEKQYYTDSDYRNAYVKDGFLTIEAHQVRQGEILIGASSTREIGYTSASITTKDVAEFKYGRIEVRAKLPHGRGIWPAIWLLGTDGHKGWPRRGEIDIMEFVGFEPTILHHSIHTMNNNWTKDNTISTKMTYNDLETAFHEYAVERYSDRIVFFIDDKQTFSYAKESSDVDSWPFDDDMYLIINMAIGGGWGGQKGIDDGIFPQKYMIDYVRVYE